MQSRKIVQVKDVSKSYFLGDEETRVLKNVSFDIRAGEFIAVVGASGNGKSTLLNMLTGIDHPSRGEVIVNGQAIHDLDENALAAWRGVNQGIVFQFFQLLPALNLLQNVILPMEFAGTLKPRARKKRAMALLDLVGLADQAHKLPSMISGGQQQRAAIARALANDPPLLLADEPTGNLDARTSEAVFGIFDLFVEKGKTLIMVTHDTELADRAGRVIEVVNGQTIEKTDPGMPSQDRLQRIPADNGYARLRES